jgi:hypothetical protein
LALILGFAQTLRTRASLAQSIHCFRISGLETWSVCIQNSRKSGTQLLDACGGFGDGSVLLDAEPAVACVLLQQFESC